MEDICRYYDIPKKYLEHLFVILKNNMYLKTKRGSSGGFMLAKSAKDIKISEIIRLMDGALAPTESVSKYFYSHTPLEKEKKMIKILKEIRDYISDKLENISLESLI
jgi:Rrf2 family transcriptional regulator, cysteine metabolism repressor